jgi:hypothetical protein
MINKEEEMDEQKQKQSKATKRQEEEEGVKRINCKCFLAFASLA